MPHANKPIIKHKTELLHLAEELGNISRVCKVKGLSRDTFYHHRELVDDGDQVHISSDNGARLVLIAGEPLKEPMARGGPFVMNTREEVQQAFMDYQNGVLA